MSDDAEVSWPSRQVLAPLLAWLVPGAGHFFLGRRLRAVTFLVIVVVAALVGTYLDGKLYRFEEGHPLTMLGTFASLGMGLPYLLLRFVVGYAGDIVAAGYEYGTAFLLTAGLMNWLVVLDSWDIAVGRKE